MEQVKKTRKTPSKKKEPTTRELLFLVIKRLDNLVKDIQLSKRYKSNEKYPNNEKRVGYIKNLHYDYANKKWTNHMVDFVTLLVFQEF